MFCNSIQVSRNNNRWFRCSLVKFNQLWRFCAVLRLPKKCVIIYDGREKHHGSILGGIKADSNREPSRNSIKYLFALLIDHPRCHAIQKPLYETESSLENVAANERNMNEKLNEIQGQMRHWWWTRWWWWWPGEERKNCFTTLFAPLRRWLFYHCESKTIRFFIEITINCIQYFNEMASARAVRS